MEDNLSLDAFISDVDRGPSGIDDAVLLIQQCAESKSNFLDLQQMGLTDSDMQQLGPHLHTICTHVTSLNLFMNELRELPEFIGVLNNLTSLQAGCNPLESISTDLLPKLPCLTELDVGFSETLTELPDTFSHTPQLATLDAGNNRIASLPLSLFTCSMLQHLNVYGNCIKNVPEQVGNLTQLKSINVGRNQLTQLPSQLGSCSLLTTIHAYENSLESIPPSISQIPNLQVLTVHSNPMLPVAPREVRSAPGARAQAEYYASLAPTES